MGRASGAGGEANPREELERASWRPKVCAPSDARGAVSSDGTEMCMARDGAAPAVIGGLEQTTQAPPAGERKRLVRAC